MITKEYVITNENGKVKITTLDFENALTLFQKVLSIEKEHKNMYCLTENTYKDLVLVDSIERIIAWSK